ncbi:MAG: helix-turn-helix domain-containing protein [Actinobacteria bacterium]|nr:helix-turn-helix domain-containing protein [Actinomycetota bacterium]
MAGSISPNGSVPVGHRLLTVVEAADELRISRSSVYRLFDTGQLAWVQIGASRRVASKEIERFITAQNEEAAS